MEKRKSLFTVIFSCMVALAFALFLCRCGEQNGGGGGVQCADNDGDGFNKGGILCHSYNTPVDCDDTDPDNWFSCDTCRDGDNDGWFVDCDAYTTRNGPDCDDAVINVWTDCSDCADNDGDGWGAGTTCDSSTVDCDDGDTSINPGATEVCDGVDNDCDGQADEGLLNTYYLDADGDGYGDPNNSTQDCSAPAGYVADNTDCDDGDANINPGATEGPAGDATCSDAADNDCDGLVDANDPDCQ